MRYIFLYSALICTSFLMSCKPSLEIFDTVTIMAYNADSFFDSTDDGVEYSEFSTKTGLWNAGKYDTRLDRLAQVILAASSGGPDIIAFAEIENAKVLEDLVSKKLAQCKYHWKITSPDTDSAIRCGILSKLPIISANAHRASEVSLAKNQPRLLLEVELDAGERSIILLIAHWKSKIGGAAVTEPERISQAAIAANRIRTILESNPDAELILLGDLNENPDEYRLVNGLYQTALMPFGTGKTVQGILITNMFQEAGINTEGVALWSPWFECSGWSYCYNGKPERIDHVLLSPGLFDPIGYKYAGFNIVSEEFLFNNDGLPAGYDIKTGIGYSDHLPILLELKLIK